MWASRVAQREPLPHISARDPSALKKCQRVAAWPESSSSRKMMPSAPMLKAWGHRVFAQLGIWAGDTDLARLSMTMKSLPLPCIL
jgi:hypothetical protein